MMSVLRTVQGAGDYDRLAQGVYENFLNMKIKDSTMKSVSTRLFILIFIFILYNLDFIILFLVNLLWINIYYSNLHGKVESTTIKRAFFNTFS